MPLKSVPSTQTAGTNFAPYVANVELKYETFYKLLHNVDSIRGSPAAPLLNRRQSKSMTEGIDRKASSNDLSTLYDLTSSRIARVYCAVAAAALLAYLCLFDDTFGEAVLGHAHLLPSGLHFHRSRRTEAIVSRVPALQHPHYTGNHAFSSGRRTLAYCCFYSGADMYMTAECTARLVYLVFF